MADKRNMEEEFEDASIITLFGEDGEEEDFQFVDYIEYKKEEYVVLLPLNDLDEDNASIEILKVTNYDEETETEDYESVEDEYVLEKVYEIFREKHKDTFNFAD